YVDPAAIKAKFFFHRQVLTGEGFVDLDQVYLFQLQPGLFECETSRWHGAAAHDLRIDTRDAPAYDASHGLSALFFSLGESHHDHRRAAIDDAAGVSGGDGSILTKSRLQFGKRFHGGIGTQ